MSGEGRVLKVRGTDKYKTLVGNEKPDHFIAYDKASYNTMSGGEGNDILEVLNNTAYNTLDGGTGKDTLVAGGGTSFNILSGNQEDDVLWVSGYAEHNTLNGGTGDDMLKVSMVAFNNILNGGYGKDNLKAYGYAKHNTLNGGEGDDNLQAYEEASYNILNGDEGDDLLAAHGNAHYITLNGGEGHNEIQTYGESSCNTLNGGPLRDILQAFGHTSWNILNGGDGNDLLVTHGGASYGTLCGGEGNDLLKVYGHSFANTLRGGKGNDTIYAYSEASSNILDGDEDNDVIISLAGGTLRGGADDDFIWTHLTDSHVLEEFIMEGGVGHDILIHSGLFWQGKANEDSPYFRSSKIQATLNGESGNDIIITSIHLDRLGIDEFQGSINKHKQKVAATGLTPSNEIRDITYQISTGKGKDIIALSSIPGQKVTTHVKDFDWEKDKLAFDSQEMAETILSELALSKALSFTDLSFQYKGHAYYINSPDSVSLATITNNYGREKIKIEYPVFKQKFDVKLDYLLYNMTALTNILSKVSDPTQLNQSLLNGIFTRKTFSQSYTVNLNKDIFLMTKQTLDLIPGPGYKNFDIQSGNNHVVKTTVPFQVSDLFVYDDENFDTYLYQNLKTNTVHYFGNTTIPSGIVAIVVVQENINGITFTTQPDNAILTLSSTTKTIQTFKAYDFFTKGHFTKLETNKSQKNLSVTMKISLVYRDQNNHLISTPLSDPTFVKVEK